MMSKLMRNILSFLVALMTGLQHQYIKAESLSPWLVYYSDEAPIDAFDSYRLLILDSDYHPPIQPFVDRSKTVLGYISLGEIASHKVYFEEVKKEGLVLYENENWKGNFFIDIRDKRWLSRIIEEMIPQILQQGFQGIFIDTLDNPIELERVNPDLFEGMIKSAENIIRSIRHHYPDMIIMLNRAYAILPKTGKYIDMVLGESIYTSFNFRLKKSLVVSDEQYQAQVDILKQAKKDNPKLHVFTLDYWDPEDTIGIKNIYKKQRENEFIPYVSIIDLNKIIPEPE